MASISTSHRSPTSSSPRPGGAAAAPPPPTNTASTADAPGPSILHPAHSLLSRAHSPDTATRIFTDKVKNKPLFVASTTTSDKRALRRHIRLRKKEYYLRKRRPRPLSAREKRDLGVFDLKKEEVEYDVYRGLHELWNGYMLEILGYQSGNSGRKADGQKIQQNQNQHQNRGKEQSLKKGNGSGNGKEQGQRQGPQQQRQPATTPMSTLSSKVITAQSHGSLLASADFHGAEVEVVRCADPGRIGTKGIVVRDTKFTFVVVTPRNQVRTLPKENTVFRYEVCLPQPAPLDASLATAGQAEPVIDGHEHDDNDNDAEGHERQPQLQPQRLVFEIHGNQFEFRPAERANRKFKWKAMEYL
ncbi:hypothetical protein A1O1_02671 [Capronia coronata CBS 617.96]|uniref:Uncharacterized protein n=1 Tax=Capronia coronata CBS 617.96 TaxID=1182541 RepID=W9YMX5_9EURO|nr:uncharacterized protein A1O1_02671 [Capronia coronata CBS 617.96]EXJ94277.1 hypothetical protein A1O1_02671 [Capronia coronata CBS 617.96]